MKKTLILILVVTICILLVTSCSDSTNNPLTLAKQFDEKDYAVKMFVDDEEIKDFADEFEVSSKGIYCIIVVAPNNGDDYEKAGIFVYCNDNKFAEKTADDLEDYARYNEDFKEEIKRQTVNIDGKIVFIGCEDTWEDIE